EAVVSRGTPLTAGCRQNLFDARPDAVSALSLDQVADLRTGDEDEVVLGGKPLRESPEGLAQYSLGPVAGDCPAHFATHRDAEPHFIPLFGFAGKAVEDE